MKSDQLRKFKHLITVELTGLQEVSAQQSEAAATVELDPARSGRLTRMDALQQQAMARAGSQRSLLRQRQLNAALQRIKKGAFGQCFGCGESIICARLEANPVATLCLACAQKREH